MFYCEGAACQKRNQCIFHNFQTCPDVAINTIVEYIDQSTNGCAGYANGKFEESWNCGDHGKYALFEPIRKLEQEFMKEVK